LALNQVNEEYNQVAVQINGKPWQVEISGAELLAAVSNVKLETNAYERRCFANSYKINPNSLLSSAETELNQSFRDNK
jgi:hypothetical protein